MIVIINDEYLFWCVFKLVAFQLDNNYEANTQARKHTSTIKQDFCNIILVSDKKTMNHLRVVAHTGSVQNVQQSLCFFLVTRPRANELLLSLVEYFA